MKKFYDYCFYRLYGIFLSKDTGRRMGFYTAIMFISIVELNPVVIFFSFISGYKTSQVPVIIFNFIVLFLLYGVNVFYFRRNLKIHSNAVDISSVVMNFIALLLVISSFGCVFIVKFYE